MRKTVSGTTFPSLLISLSLDILLEPPLSTIPSCGIWIGSTIIIILQRKEWTGFWKTDLTEWDFITHLSVLQPIYMASIPSKKELRWKPSDIISNLI